VEPGTGHSPPTFHPNLDKVQCNHKPEQEKQYPVEDEKQDDNNGIRPEIGVPG
jgi:hypothetical protein